MPCFVFGHLMYGVVDGVQILLLGQHRQLLLAVAGAGRRLHLATISLEACAVF